MMQLPEAIMRVTAIGAGATIVLDLWLLLLRQLGVQGLNFRLLGRWVGHLTRGTVAHDNIAKARQIKGEVAIGWLAHYAIGIAFAAAAVVVNGFTWVREPTLLPALAVGVTTVIAPLFIMQPAMGGGFAASKTQTPVRNCAKSGVNHAVFGASLYLAAVTTSLI